MKQNENTTSKVTLLEYWWYLDYLDAEIVIIWVTLVVEGEALDFRPIDVMKSLLGNTEPYLQRKLCAVKRNSSKCTWVKHHTSLTSHVMHFGKYTNQENREKMQMKRQGLGSESSTTTNSSLLWSRPTRRHGGYKCCSKVRFEWGHSITHSCSPLSGHTKAMGSNGLMCWFPLCW